MGRIIRPIKLPCAKKIRATSLTLAEYHQIRNKVLIVRDVGAIGDILMMRMIFEDFKKNAPDIHITVAVPIGFMPLLEDHPFVDQVICAKNLDFSLYGSVYNITSACIRREEATAPYVTENRSDIWASHCGVDLNNHNMHLNISKEATLKCRKILERQTLIDDVGKPILLFVPLASIPARSLDTEQSQTTIDGMRKLGFNVLLFGPKVFNDLDAPTIIAPSILDFMRFINAADYIVSVDTGAFHAAGGLKKPLVGIFAWTDGKVYGKWYDFILVQRHRDSGGPSPCPCYYWHNCKLDSTPSERKPCIVKITANEIIEGTKEMIKKWAK